MYFFTSSENKFSGRYYPMGVFTPVYPTRKLLSGEIMEFLRSNQPTFLPSSKFIFFASELQLFLDPNKPCRMTMGVES